MNDPIIKKIESIFRGSTSQDELFDAFAEALKNNISDFDLYKILLANPCISSDEIKMYSEKLIRELPQSSYYILIWTAKIFESHSQDLRNIEDTINYYERAMLEKPAEFEPFAALLKLYNYEVDAASNKRILNLVESGINKVIKKSHVYYLLSDLYKRSGKILEASRYLSLAEKSARFERE